MGKWNKLLILTRVKWTLWTKVQNENHDVPKFFLLKGKYVDDIEKQMCLYQFLYCLCLSIYHSSFWFLLPYVPRSPVILFREVQNYPPNKNLGYRSF